MKKNCIRNMKKRIRKMQKGKQSWQPEQKSRQCVTQRKTQKRKRADLSQHRRGSVRQEKWFPERKAVGQERKHRIVPEIRGSLYSSRFHTMRWEGTVSAGCRTSFIPRRSVFMTSTISWHRMKIRTPSLKTGVIS